MSNRLYLSLSLVSMPHNGLDLTYLGATCPILSYVPCGLTYLPTYLHILQFAMLQNLRGY